MIASLLLAVTIVAHEPGYYTSLAKHLQRWLGDEKIAARVVTPREMPTALANERLAFLVGFAQPTAADMKTLKAFRSRGGKLVVFHSAAPALAALMDVKPLGFAAAPYAGAWSCMNFSGVVPEGTPRAIRQTSTVLLRAAPVAGRGRVIATWSDRRGRSTGEPAWIATGAGYWMTHVLLADGDEDLKACLCAAIVGFVEPGKWSFGAHRARESKRRQDLTAYAARQVPRTGEIRAVWDHSGCGLYPGNWPQTMNTLKAAHVTDLFVNVAGAGFAHYASALLPRSKTFQQEGDQLAACLAAARGTGIRVHAWMLCFTASRSTPDRMEIFRKKGWRLKTPDGRLTEYINPAREDVRAYVLDAIGEVANRYPVAGIHLDFVRWGDTAAKPKDAAATITRFVMAARQRVRHPKWLTTAVYGKYPRCIETVGQDWESWLNLNTVDYVVPMDYTESNLQLTGLLTQQALNRAHAHKTIVGLGVTANESRLDARQVIDQINLTRKFGFAGNALFDLDVTLERQIFPYLSLGLWRN